MKHDLNASKCPFITAVCGKIGPAIVSSRWSEARFAWLNTSANRGNGTLLTTASCCGSSIG